MHCTREDEWRSVRSHVIPFQIYIFTASSEISAINHLEPNIDTPTLKLAKIECISYWTVNMLIVTHALRDGIAFSVEPF
jgi:hypothetical protein